MRADENEASPRTFAHKICQVISRLQAALCLRLGKEAEYQKIRLAARELLASGLSRREQNRRFRTLVEAYDPLPVKLREEVRKT